MSCTFRTSMLHAVCMPTHILYSRPKRHITSSSSVFADLALRYMPRLPTLHSVSASPTANLGRRCAGVLFACFDESPPTCVARADSVCGCVDAACLCAQIRTRNETQLVAAVHSVPNSIGYMPYSDALMFKLCTASMVSRIDMCMDKLKDMCAGMCSDMYGCIWTDMILDMRTDMCMTCVHACVWTCA